MFVVYGMRNSSTFNCVCVRVLRNKNVCVRTEYILAVNSMSILCLWNIQLTFDWDEIEP